MTAQEIVDQINSMELWSPCLLEDTMVDTGFDMNGVSDPSSIQTIGAVRYADGPLTPTMTTAMAV